MSIIDRLRSMLGGSKADAGRGDQVDVTQELAIEAVQDDIDAVRTDAPERLSDMPGASDDSAPS